MLSLPRKRLLGAAVLIGTVLIAYLGILKPNPFAYHEDVYAMFDHVQSIALVQRNVRVAGVNVGTIGTVRRVGVHAEVEMILDQHIQIYRDATATLRPHTPFEGTAFIDLDPGTAGAGSLGANPIPRAQTSVFVSAGTVFSTFTAPVRRGFQTIVGQLSVALGHRGQTGLRAALDNAPDLLKDTAAVAPALRGVEAHRTDALQQLIPGMASTVDALAGHDDQLAGAARDAASTLNAVATDDAVPFGESIDALPQTLAGVRSAGAHATAIVNDARTTAADLIPTLRQIPRATPAITSLLRDAAPVLGNAAPPIDDFATALTEVGQSGPALKRLLDTLHGTAGQLRTSLIPALDAPTKLGLPTYLQLIAATTGFTGVLDSFVSQSQVGGAFATGHDLRVTLQGPVTLPLAALDIPCSVIGAINAKAIPVVEALGLCTT